MSSARPSTPRLPVIGLVGGIGSGKSMVAAMLAQEGCLVCNSDALGHQALEDPAIKAQLHAWWGGADSAAGAGAAAAPTGSTGQAAPGLTRARIAQIVFADPAQRARLEALVHPWIERRRAELFASPPPGTVALVIDAPLLLEAGLADQCDAVIFVDSPPEQRLERVRTTRGWSAEELARREAAQWPLDRKRACAHHVLRNDDGSDALRAQVRQVLQQVRTAYGRSPR